MLIRTALAMLTALALLASPAGATLPGRNGVIAFSVQRGDDYELMTVRPTGGGLVQLTRNAVDDTQPAWSPDGQLMAFVRGRSRIWYFSGDGTRHKLAAGTFPAWSPDERRIAFVRRVSPRDFGLAVMNVPDGSRVRVLAKPVSDLGPSWSPDGKRIVFVRDGNLWIVGANGRGLRRLTATEEDEADPDWAPDGSKIVFARHHPCGGSCDVPGLVTIRPDGSNEVEITDYEGLEQPSWSPDGTKIVATGGGRKGLTILSSSGKVLRVIAAKADVSDQGIFDPAWQPIGG